MSHRKVRNCPRYVRRSASLMNAVPPEVLPMTEPLSRRSFLRQAGGVALAPAAASGAESTSQQTSAPPGGEDYWHMVRRQFAFRETRVPMNAANLCPSPRVVAEQVTELTHAIDVDCSFQNRAQFDKLLETSRQKVAEHLGV